MRQGTVVFLLVQIKASECQNDVSFSSELGNYGTDKCSNASVTKLLANFVFQFVDLSQ